MVYQFKTEKERSTSKKLFIFPIVLNGKNRVFNPYSLIGTCPIRKTLLRVIQRLNLLSFPWKINLIFLANFMGNPLLTLKVPIMTAPDHKFLQHLS